MNIIDSISQELAHEASATRKALERVPEGKLAWKPHEKSMTLGQLVSHMVEIPGWAGVTIQLSEFTMDPETYKPWMANTRAELLAKFDSNVTEAQKAMEGVTNEHLMQPWAFIMGGEKVFEMPRVVVLRNMILNHAVHHRGQLSVYLRLLNIPVPATYGPSADEK
jgi:uncharacterized damage-inducible protein DinB